MLKCHCTLILNVSIQRPVRFVFIPLFCYRADSGYFAMSILISFLCKMTAFTNWVAQWFSCNNQTDEVNKLFIIWYFQRYHILKRNTTCKAALEVIFDICCRPRGHSGSCALNRNEHGNAIKTTRHSFFDNETVLDMNLRSIENQWLVSEKPLKNTSP